MKLKGMTATSRSSTVEASDAVFGQPANPVLLAQAVRVYLSNLRQGTSKVKSRSYVKRTKSKWYRQKGTGRARHGSRNAPLFVGGGVAHGPTGQENWDKKLSKQMKIQALRVALSMQADKIVVTDNLNSLKGKTAEAAKLFNKMFDEMKKTLVVLGEDTAMIRRSVHNLPQVMTIGVDELNALHVAAAETIVLSKHSLERLEKRLATRQKAASSAQKTPATKAAVKKTTKTKAKNTKATKKTTKK